MPEKWKSLLQKYKYILLVLAVGILLMMLPTGQEEKDSAQLQQQWQEFSLKDTENRLRTLLQKIEGVGKVDLMLTLKSGSQLQLAQDEDSSLQEGKAESQRETVILSRGSGLEEIVVTQQRYPTYQGALVVCEGAGNSSVCLAVTEAVSAITGLSSDKISIEKWSS
ncbi:MAG: stage III sporulation protein AG [Ruminococcaceae bacterium]|nr:stage III sporulation protein AG [Oscillospiraceae bacterium]